MKTSDIVLQSTLTCPHCGHRKEETMPTDACQFFYECENCKTVLKPKAGDCCVTDRPLARPSRRVAKALVAETERIMNMKTYDGRACLEAGFGSEKANANTFVHFFHKRSSKFLDSKFFNRNIAINKYIQKWV